MGVRGLQSYVEKHCPNVCHVVSIAQMAEDYRKMYHSAKPTIAVDGMSLFHGLYCASLEWIYGGQWVQFCEIIEDFINQFEKIGVKLVFFFDGTVESAKMERWVEKRLRKLNETVEMFEFMKRYRREPTSENFKWPITMGSLVRFILKCRTSTEVYSTIREADVEIAEYAKNHHDVFAILGQDSDFMIYDTKPYLSAEHLDLEQMTTVLYDRRALARKLSLSVPMLPLFSCIMGNDIIPASLLRSFHRILCDTSGASYPSFAEIAPMMAGLINSSRWTGDFNNRQEMTKIAETVMGDGRKASLLCDALRNYHITPEPKRALTVMEKKHVMCEVSHKLYNILHHQELRSTESLEDCEGQNLPPTTLIYRPVRRRMYSILFAEKPNTVVNEWCAYLGNSMEAPERVTPLPLPIRRTCKLRQLWSDSPEFQDAKYEHFLGCLSSTLTPKDLLQVPKRYVVLVSILNYLLTFNPPVLRLWEVNVFLVQAVTLTNTDVDALYELKVPWVDARAVNLASIFTRGVVLAVMLLGTCGYPFSLSDAMPWNFFDGKLFHDTYIRAAKNPKIEYLCKTQAKVAEVNFLFSVVVSGTAWDIKDIKDSRIIIELFA